jgi:hypothetical protein
MRTKEETQELKNQIETATIKNLTAFFGSEASIEKIYNQSAGCIPPEFLGEDVSTDIENKFYAWLDATRIEFEKETAIHLQIVIEPSYEGSTCYLAHDGDIVYFLGDENAWNAVTTAELLDKCISLYDDALSQAKKHGKKVR